MQRFFLCVTMCSMLASCGGSVTIPGVADTPTPTPLDASTAPDTCAPFEPGNNACLAALERLNHCCWDAQGPSRDFASGLGQQALCERIRSTGRDPVQACNAIQTHITETDPSASLCTFDSEFVTSGAVLGFPLCCCHQGFRCTGGSSNLHCE